MHPVIISIPIVGVRYSSTSLDIFIYGRVAGIVIIFVLVLASCKMGMVPSASNKDSSNGDTIGVVIYDPRDFGSFGIAKNFTQINFKEQDCWETVHVLLASEH